MSSDFCVPWKMIDKIKDIISLIKNKSNLSLQTDERNLILLKNTLFSVFSKGITMLTGFIMIPLSLLLVSKSELGLWLTISSFLGWLSLLDFGVGNGLRNKLTEALSRNDMVESRVLVSTAYSVTFIIFTASILVFFVLSYFINWVSLLNAPQLDESLLRWIIVTTFSGFALQMIVRLLFALYSATHNTGKVDLVNAAIQVVIIALLYLMLLLNPSKDKIIVLILINNLTPLVLLLGYSVFEFKTKLSYLKPSIKLANFSKAKSIFGLGLQFLVLQIVGYILIGSQQFMVGKIFSQEDVVNFTIPQKYYSILLVGWLIVITPFWSLLTEAHAKKDFIWIRQKLREMLKLYLLTPLAGLALFFVAPFVYKLWVGNNYIQDKYLDASILFFFCTVCFNSTIVIFLNAFSRTRVQLIISIVVAALAIFTCFYSYKFFSWELYLLPVICSLYLLIAGITVFLDLKLYLKRVS